MVSIIIPNFNKAAFLPETLRSIQAQNEDSWEVLVVDDGSTDQSLELLEGFTQSDQRIRLLQRDRLPKGANTCRNIGLDKAQGEYLIFLDADDLLAPDCLQRRTEFMNSNPELAFAVFTTGTFFQTIGDHHHLWKTRPEADHLRLFLQHDLPWTIFAPIWRRESLLPFGGFNERYPRMQDVEFHTRALLSGKLRYKVADDPAPTAYYRISSERMVHHIQRQLEHFLEGVLLYTEDMQALIHSQSHTATAPLYHALKGTVIAGLLQVLYHQRTRQLSTASANELCERLFAATPVKELMGSKGIRSLRIYRRFYLFGCYRIKGFNYLSKKIISTL